MLSSAWGVDGRLLGGDDLSPLQCHLSVLLDKLIYFLSELSWFCENLGPCLLSILLCVLGFRSGSLPFVPDGVK